MKKSIYLFSVILFISGIAKSQSLNPPAPGANIYKPDNSQFAKMTNIIPPAPDASAIARYGGIGVNLNSGSVNKSIQLKAVTNKSLTVPISIFFNSAGIKVNDYPSRVGMGWAINTGGQISRVIHGGDDLLYERYVPNFTIYPNEEDLGTTEYCWQLTGAGNRDAEPDVFSFSAGNYTGKFIFDNSGNILQLPASNVKIELNNHSPSNDDYTFKITTPDGIQFFYGGIDSKEKTKITTGSNPGNSYHATVWCLNKVEHPNRYSITYIYEGENIGPYSIDLEQTHYKLSSDAAMEICDGTICLDGVFGTQYECFSDLFANIAKLKEINTSDGTKVTFDYSVYNYPEKVITGINYFNENNKRIIRYAFNYNFVQTSGVELPFLDKITELDEQNVALNTGHSFAYYGLSNIPKRILSFSQDHWGFFNGKSNTTLIVKPDDEELALQMPNSTANRNADPQYAVNGMISKITYPTGGKDEIEYEGNTIEELQDQNPYADVSQMIVGTGLTVLESAGVPFSVNYENKIKISYQCEYLGSGQIDLHWQGVVWIKNIVTNVIVFTESLVPNSPSTIEFRNLPAGSYKLYVSSKGLDIRTSASVKYRTGTTPNMQNVTVYTGGMRVKKTITSNNAVNNPIVKRYYYGTFSNLNYSSSAPVVKPKYFVAFDYLVGILSGNCSATYRTYQHKALHYSSVSKLYLYDGQAQEYTSVIESIGGDNFENGAIEHKFDVYHDIEAQHIRGWYNLGSPPTNTYYLSNGEIETNVFAKKAGILVPTSSAQNEITIDTRKFTTISFLNVNKKADLPCTVSSNGHLVGPYPLIHMIFDINRYNITSAWKYLSKTTEKKYDEDGQNPFTQITNYYYDDDRNLMLSRTEVLNSKQELLKYQNKYPHDFAATGNVYEDMVNKNMVATNIETKVFKNGQELFNKKDNYSNSWFVDKHVVAIENAEEQKIGNPSEVRFKYYSYDTDGNPTELSKQDNARQTVIWDYKVNYPIAKIINASQPDVAFTSFEADGKGYWTFTGTPVSDNTPPPTGKKIYTFNGFNAITKSGLNSSIVYIVSYWTKNASAFTITGTISGYPVSGRILGQWQYFEHRIIGQSSISVNGSGSIDELRLYPEKALMTTYTYESMIGMTGQCDANNKTTYYEYDNFNRLAIVRDQDRNILKKFCYNYAGQTEDCTSPCTNFEPIWQNTTEFRCQQGSCGNTGYQEQKQVDINPCNQQSPTPPQWVVAGYNPTACPVSTCVNLTSTNVVGNTGYTASYDDGAGHIYPFAVPTATGLQPLGSIPAGIYTLTISRTTGAPMWTTFKSGCKFQVITGGSAVFYNIPVSATGCNSITVDTYFD